MTESEILEGNKLICEFLGGNTGLAHRIENTDTLYWKGETVNYFRSLWNMPKVDNNTILLEHCRFHEDWNSLIDVIERIESIRNEQYGFFQVFIHSNVCNIQSKYLHLDLQGSLPEDKKVYFSDPNAIFPTKIESVWYSIVQFIKWYNLK